MYLLEIVDWKKSSAFAVIANLLIDKIGTEEWRLYASKPIYQRLLDKFIQIYQLKTLDWNTLLKNIQGYTHPHDQQVIWIPPLRALLEESPLEPNEESEVLSIVEMSKLCQMLSLELKISYLAKEEIHTTVVIPNNNISEKSLATLNTFYINSTWHAITNVPAKAYSYTTLLEKITSCLISLSFSELKINILNTFKNESYALHVAISTEQDVLASKLIQEGADIYMQNADGLTPLHLVCALDKKNILLDIIKYKQEEYQNLTWFKKLTHYQRININIPDVGGKTALHYAARSNSIDIVQLLFDRDPAGFALSATMQDKNKVTPLHIAASHHSSEMLNIFSQVKNSYDIYNSQDQWGMTPLHYAVMQKNNKNMVSLLHVNANTEISADQRELQKTFFSKGIQVLPNKLTPLWVALEMQQFEMIALLIKKKEDLVEIKTSNGLTAIHLAALQGRNDLIQKWINQFGLENVVMLQSSDGKKPIHYAAQGGQLETFSLLAFQGAGLLSKDIQGNTPLHIAAEFGQLNIVKFICEEVEKENQIYQNLAENNWKNVWGVNKVIENFGKMRQALRGWAVPLEIDPQNGYGETPYLLALHKQNTDTVNILKKYGARPTSVLGIFTSILYKSSLEDADIAQFAGLAERYSDILLNNIDIEGNSLLHLSILTLQYTIARIILHPLSIEQRKKLCTSQNQKSLTALGLVEQQITLYKNQIIENPKNEDETKKNHVCYQNIKILEKIERHLIQYDLDRKKEKHQTFKQIMEYQYQCEEDEKDELMQTSSYKKFSTFAIVATPVWKGITITCATGLPWLGMEAAVGEYFGVDPLDATERGLNLLTPTLSADSYFQRPATLAQNTLSWLGWYRHTAMRISLEMVRKGSAATLQYLKPEISKNYVKNMNMLGAFFFLGEELVGRKQIGPYVAQRLPNVESALNTIGVPTLNEMGNYANTHIDQYTGINFVNNISSNYAWAREHLGQVLPPNKIFREEIEQKLMSQILVEDETARASIRKHAENLFVNNYEHSDELNIKLQNFIDYVNYGENTIEAISILHEVCSQTDNEALDYGICIADLATNNVFYRNQYFDQSNVEQFKAQISKSVNTLPAQKLDPNLEVVRNILLKVEQDAVRLYATKLTQQSFMPVLNIENTFTQNLIEKGITSFVEKHIHEGEYLQNALQDMAQCLNTGDFNESCVSSIDDIASIMEEAGENYGEVFAQWILSTPFYQNPYFENELEIFREALVSKINVAHSQNQQENNLLSIVSELREHAIYRYSEKIVDKYVMPEIVVKDDKSLQYIRDAAVIYFNLHNDDESDLNGKMQAFIHFENYGELTDESMNVLYDISAKLQSQGKDHGDFLANLVINNAYFQAFAFSNNPALIEKLSKEINELDMLRVDSKALLKTLLTENEKYIRWYFASSRKEGWLVADVFTDNTGCKQGNQCAAGRAEYMAEQLVYTNYHEFYLKDSKQIAADIKFLKETIHLAQEGKKKKNEKKAIANYNMANTFFICKLYVKQFFDKEGLDDRDAIILNGLDQIHIRAAFAVHGLTMMMEDPEQFNPMGFQEQFQLFQQFIDEQYGRTPSKSETGIHNLVVETLLYKAKSAWDIHPIWGQYTVDEAADVITDNSKKAGEFNWHNTTDTIIRAIKVKRPTRIRDFFKSSEENVKKVVREIMKKFGGGISTDGSNSRAGVYDLDLGGMTNISVPIGKTPGRMTFEMDNYVNKRHSLEIQNVNMEQEHYASAELIKKLAEQYPLQKSTTLSEYLDNSWEHLVIEQTAVRLPNPLEVFQSAYEQYKEKSSDSVANNKKHSLENIIQNTAYVSPEIIQDPMLKASISKGHSENQVQNRLSEILKKTDKVFSTLLLPVAYLAEIISSPVKANPVVASSTLLSVEGVAFTNRTPIYTNAILDPNSIVFCNHTLMYIFAANNLIENVKEVWGKLTYPIHPQENNIYPGRSPNEANGIDILSFPIHEQEFYYTETLIKQPGSELRNDTIYPAYENFKELDRPYLKSAGNGTSNDSALFSDKRVYDDNYTKHKQASGGGARWKDASVNPIPNAEIGQRLLDSAYTDPKNNTQLFNYYDGKIVKFRTSNDGRWHSYEVNKNITEELNPKVLKQFYNDGLITKVEYKKLLKL